MKLIKNFPVKINEKRLRKRINSAHRDTPEWVETVIKECLDRVEPTPMAAYKFFAAEIDNKKNTIELGGEKFHSGFMVERFSSARELALMIVTIGSQIEDLARKQFSEGEMLRGVIYDAIGSEFVESAADAAEKLIENEKGCCMSRYSPGYNDWDIKEQAKLFSLVDGSTIGVKLNDSFLMIPEKSISALLGLSDREIKQCRDCTRSGCRFREHTDK